MRSDAANSRIRLLTATRDVVAEQGHTEVSTKDIAVRAGVSTATLYRHFDNKDALIDEVSIARWSRMERYARQGMDPAYDSLRHIVGILEAFTRMTTADDRFISAAGLQVGRSPMAIQPIRHAFERPFASMWVSAQEHHQIRKAADPRDAVLMAGAIRDSARRLPMLTTLVAGICTEQVNAETLIREMFLPDRT